MLAGLLGLLGCAPEPDTVVRVDQVDVVPLPNWEVVSATADGSCGGLLQYCVRQTCAVKNRDPAGTTGELVFELEQRQGTVERRVPVELGPTQQAEIAAEFPEAKLFGGETNVHCHPARTGTRVTCSVVNGGKRAHEVEVVAAITDAAGAPSAERRTRVHLAPGERLQVPILFDKVNEAGTCEVHGDAPGPGPGTEEKTAP